MNYQTVQLRVLPYIQATGERLSKSGKRYFQQAAEIDQSHLGIQSAPVTLFWFEQDKILKPGTYLADLALSAKNRFGDLDVKCINIRPMVAATGTGTSRAAAQ